MPSEITVASTTDSQEAINASAGIVEEPTTEKETPDGEEPETDKPASEAAEKDDKEGQRPESKSAVQKRIDKLTRDKYENKKEIEDLKQRLLAIEKGGKAQPGAEENPPEEKVAVKPKPDDFGTYEEFAEALADWKYEDRRRKEKAAEAEAASKRAQEQAANEVANTYNKRVAEAKERYDDFEDVVGRSTAIPDAVIHSIIRMENGPDVAYYLGKNPKVCKKMMDLANSGDLLSAIVEAGKISQALMPTEEVEVEDEEGEGVTVPKVTTKAKIPVRPVAGSSTRTTVPIDELPYNEYRRIREKQEKERFRR